MLLVLLSATLEHHTPRLAAVVDRALGLARYVRWFRRGDVREIAG